MRPELEAPANLGKVNNTLNLRDARGKVAQASQAQVVNEGRRARRAGQGGNERMISIRPMMWSLRASRSSAGIHHSSCLAAPTT
jgi:hypothetical protein